MNDFANEIEVLSELFNRLLASPMLPRGEEWKGEWPDWKRDETWFPDASGVYILWETSGGIKDGKPPVYVGEGCFGHRIHESFHGRNKWQFAQMICDDRISRPGKIPYNRRIALERVCILVLNPLENLR